jgi:methionine sulfoxide reductase heme-binding subunit
VLHHVVQFTAAVSAHDQGLRQAAQVAARTSYVLSLLTLIWGTLVSTGWVERLTGRQAMRSSHMMLAALAVGFGALHFLSFLYAQDQNFTIFTLLFPASPDGTLRWTFGIIGWELMLAILISTGVVRFMIYRRWLWLHRMAYPAVGLIVLHSLFGAIQNGHLAIVWFGGLTVLVPGLLITALRIVPPRVLTKAGLVEEEM